MDNDDYRRGKLACHKKFDEATAVLAGDALLALAFEVLAEEKRPGIALKSIKELSASIGSLGVAGGQCVDIEFEGKKKTAAVLNYINTRKTAELIKASVKIGALASGARPGKIDKMEKFGMAVGEAFQIVDDVLDNGDSVSVLGRERAIKKVRALTKTANESLKDFKGSADVLKKIADYLIERKY